MGNKNESISKTVTENPAFYDVASKIVTFIDQMDAKKKQQNNK